MADESSMIANLRGAGTRHMLYRRRFSPVSQKCPTRSFAEKNGRRHEVDFGDAPLKVEIYASEETVEIFVEADFDTAPEERRRFAILNIPRHQFSQAAGEAARRAQKQA